MSGRKDDNDMDGLKPDKKYIYCARCGEELGGTYHFYVDNYLQVKYFEQQDGSDNAFCSETCAAVRAQERESQ
ncbi:MAG TPA: hypothetical protein DEQ02_08150 [Ruminococcaceae bacterium]|nr:hypothetical protein [Oscillospiraceae bacterium]